MTSGGVVELATGVVSKLMSAMLGVSVSVAIGAAISVIDTSWLDFCCVVL